MPPTVHPWASPPNDLVLTSADVHVWRASLYLPLERVFALEQILAQDERQRADRFVRPEDRTRFIVGRGLLRSILGCYLSTDPGKLKFYDSPFGKPALAHESKPPVIRFNLSHAGGLALYAVAAGREVGVDIECIRPDFGTEEIAERFFSRREVAMLRALPASSRLKAFFDCWTRKEAYLKARGEGLSLPLDRFDVSFSPGQPAALLSVHDNPTEVGRWSLRELFPGPGHVAAVAVEGHAWHLRCWQWPKS